MARRGVFSLKCKISLVVGTFSTFSLLTDPQMLLNEVESKHRIFTVTMCLSLDSTSYTFFSEKRV